MIGFRSDFSDSVCIMIAFAIDVRDYVDSIRSKTGFGTDLHDSVGDIRIMEWLGMTHSWPSGYTILNFSEGAERIHFKPQDSLWPGWDRNQELLNIIVE